MAQEGDGMTEGSCEAFKQVLRLCSCQQGLNIGKSSMFVSHVVLTVCNNFKSTWQDACSPYTVTPS